MGERDKSRRFVRVLNAAAPPVAIVHPAIRIRGPPYADSCL
jgi:hypothetical protein